MKICFLLSIFFIFTTQSAAQSFSSNTEEHYQTTADDIISSALKDTVGYNWTRQLCQIGPRLSGSENSMKAIKWAEHILNKMNLDTVWLQPFMVPNWQRGSIETTEIINSEFAKSLSVAAYGRSVGTTAEGITGNVIEVKSFEELQSRKDEAKGKIIFYNYHFNQTFVNTFEAYSDAVKFRGEGVIEAAKVGGIGAIVRSVTSKYDNVPHVGNMKEYPDSLTKVPSVAIGLIDADYLSDALKKYPDLKINIKLSAQTLPDAQSYNVIAEIKGSEKPEEIIVVGAHFDSWDKGDGAHDDGAPSVQVMEVLDLFKRLNMKPKRTIRCVLFINEENGIKGALKYSEYVDSLKEYHIAAIESDAGASTPRGYRIDSDSLTINKMQKWLPVLNKSLIEWIKPGGSGVDVKQIKNAKALMGFVPDGQRYFDVHHSDNDVFETVHPREMELGTAAIAIMAYLISEEGL